MKLFSYMVLSLGFMSISYAMETPGEQQTSTTRQFLLFQAYKAGLLKKAAAAQGKTAVVETLTALEQRQATPQEAKTQAEQKSV
jgi:hypothetical protein